jgi:PAS domain S-box-containing protein
MNESAFVPHVVALLLVGCVVFAGFVLIVGAMRRREARIHERFERSERLLRTSEMKYQNLMDLSPYAVSVIENGKVIFCNDQFLEMFGYAREEVMGTSFTRYIHPEDRKGAGERYVTRTDGAQIQKGIGRYVRKDGEVRWLEATGQRIEWEGAPVVIYFSSDITDRKVADEAVLENEEKYRNSEAKYRNLFEVAPQSITVVRDGKILFFNDRLLELLRYSRDEMRAMPLQ